MKDGQTGIVSLFLIAALESGLCHQRHTMNQSTIFRTVLMGIAILLVMGAISTPFTLITTADTTEKNVTQTITDLAGRDVIVPDPVTRITCLHPIPTYMAWRLAPEKLVSIDMVSKTRTYLLPESEREKFLSLPMTGVYFKGLNNEQVISLKPDVVVSMTKDPNIEKEQETFAIPVVAVKKDTIESYEPSFRLMGKLLGNEKEGDELADYWNDVIKRVTDTSSKIPEDQRLKVYYTALENAHTTVGSATIMSSMVKDAGGISYADAISLAGDPTNEHVTVPVEDVLKWNPDVIIAQNTNVSSEVMTDPIWKDTSAVKNNRVYCVPKYEFPDGVTSIIGLMWIAEKLYPDQFQFDFRNEVREYFKKFYKVSDLTDTQIDQENS